MLYVMIHQEYEDVTVHGVWAGPEGVPVKTLHDEFQKEFTWEKLGRPEQVPYHGPTSLPSPCVSGALVSGYFYTGPSVVTNSDYYQAWKKENDAAYKQWQDRRESKLAEWKTRYPGDDVWEMFVSFLEKEHGLRKTESRVTYV